MLIIILNFFVFQIASLGIISKDKLNSLLRRLVIGSCEDSVSDVAGHMKLVRKFVELLTKEDRLEFVEDMFAVTPRRLPPLHTPFSLLFSLQFNPISHLSKSSSWPTSPW